MFTFTLKKIQYLPNLGTQIKCVQNQYTSIKMDLKYPDIYVVHIYIYTYIYIYIIYIHIYVYICIIFQDQKCARDKIVLAKLQ